MADHNATDGIEYGSENDYENPSPNHHNSPSQSLDSLFDEDIIGEDGIGEDGIRDSDRGSQSGQQIGEEGNSEVSEGQRLGAASSHPPLHENMSDEQYVTTLLKYVDDGPIGLEESWGAYIIRVNRAQLNMGIQRRAMDWPEWEDYQGNRNYNEFKLRGLQRIAMRWLNHRMKITQGHPGYDQEYAEDFFEENALINAENQAARERALGAKKNFYASQEREMDERPNPPTASFDLWDFGYDGPLQDGYDPWKEMMAFKEEIEEAGRARQKRMPHSAHGTPRRDLRDIEGDESSSDDDDDDDDNDQRPRGRHPLERVQDELKRPKRSRRRCNHCAESDLSCTLLETGKTPCERCVIRGLQETCRRAILKDDDADRRDAVKQRQEESNREARERNAQNASAGRSGRRPRQEEKEEKEKKVFLSPVWSTYSGAILSPTSGRPSGQSALDRRGKNEDDPDQPVRQQFRGDPRLGLPDREGLFPGNARTSNRVTDRKAPCYIKCHPCKSRKEPCDREFWKPCTHCFKMNRDPELCTIDAGYKNMHDSRRRARNNQALGHQRNSAAGSSQQPTGSTQTGRKQRKQRNDKGKPRGANVRTLERRRKEYEAALREQNAQNARPSKEEPGDETENKQGKPGDEIENKQGKLGVVEGYNQNAGPLEGDWGPCDYCLLDEKQCDGQETCWPCIKQNIYCERRHLQVAPQQYQEPPAQEPPPPAPDPDAYDNNPYGPQPYIAQYPY